MCKAERETDGKVSDFSIDSSGSRASSGLLTYKAHIKQAVANRAVRASKPAEQETFYSREVK